jgi:putative addiction module component (TIGR02574 family)
MDTLLRQEPWGSREEHEMAHTPEEIETEALKLPEKARAELARILLLSLDPPEEVDAEQVWAEEAERRYEELRRGTASPVSSEQVFQEARSRLR